MPLSWLQSTVDTGKLIPLAAHKVASWHQGDATTLSRSITNTGTVERDAGAQARLLSARLVK